MKNYIQQPRRTIHPFPARMAPEIAIRELELSPPKLRVLDPMSGSGTVVREAIRYGHTAMGLDCDPLAVLMARVWTTPVDDVLVARAIADVMAIASSVRHVKLPWIDNDEETDSFTKYWFAKPQRDQLRRLSYALTAAACHRREGYRRAIDLARLALSRIIVTKDVGASLGRDVSHSRPHRVADESDYDVFSEFEKAVERIRSILAEDPPNPGARINSGDARKMPINKSTVDLVITSPPYLNAIDYLRGHRLALVWLGYDLSTLRGIRAEAIGAERALPGAMVRHDVVQIQEAIAPANILTNRHLKMIERYAFDLSRLMRQIRRVLRPTGRAVLVVGNSTLRGEFVRNSEGMKVAAALAGLQFISEDMRELPENRRYLPLKTTTDRSLAKRMRTENVLRFKAA